MFSFSINKPVDLSQIDLNPKTDTGREWLSELYFGAISGRITYVKSADAYAFGCKKNSERTMCRREVPFLTSDELQQGARRKVQYKGILLESPGEDATSSVPSGLTYKESSFDAIEAEDYYRHEFEEFIEMRSLIYLDLGIDFANALVQAHSGVKKAQDALRRIRSEYERIEELLTAILAGGTWLEDMKTLAAQPITCE